MKKLKTTIKVEIRDISVGDHFYKFSYMITRDGKKKKGRYSSDFDSQTAEEFKKVLENGYAIDLVLERLI